ncbi:MAG: hypothetical protein AB3N63_00440 [Puniceicoccaceae bacterium]
MNRIRIPSLNVLLAVFLSVAPISIAAEVRPADAILIEAEDFAEARTESDDFARPQRYPEASGRTVLLRIFNKGTLHYRFNAETSGTYSVWVRYTRRMDKRVASEVNGKSFNQMTSATNTKTDKRDIWRWGQLSRAKLRKGENELVIHPSPWKIDCLLITASKDYIPNDATELFARERVLSESEQRMMATQTAPLVPDFLEDFPNYELPEWFDAHRVQLHTRLGPPFMRRDPERFLKPGKWFKEMGVKVFSRHIVSGNEGAWWPSEHGAIHDMAVERNVAREIIEDAHSNGLRIIAYYRHIEDEWAAVNHPDWRCVDPDGKPIPGTRGTNMCMNSPYADLVLARQLELVKLGADGFYYDSVHMPRSGCWCDHCREKFTTMTGLEHPGSVDMDNPVWHKLKEFNNYTIARTFANWRKALHAENPELVMVVGSNLWPCLSDKHMDHRVFQILDCHKTEFNKGTVYRSPSALWSFPSDFRPMELDVRLGFGFDVARDATDGRPAHVWAHRIQAESHMLAATAGMVGHGCIANVDVRESRIPDDNFKSSFAMGERVSPFLKGTKPICHVAILHSEQARDRDGLDHRKVWRDTLYPMYGAYHVLLRDQIPCGFIFDSQLVQREFRGIQNIFVPNYGNLSEDLKSALSDFTASGGKVILNKPEWKWHTDAGWHEAVKQFRSTLNYQGNSVQAHGGNEKMHLQAFSTEDGKQLTICLMNDFSWVQVGGKGEEGFVEGDNQQSLANQPDPCKGVRLRIPGKPSRVFEANSGKELTWSAEGVDIPEFQNLAVIVAQY